MTNIERRDELDLKSNGDRSIKYKEPKAAAAKQYQNDVAAFVF